MNSKSRVTGLTYLQRMGSNSMMVVGTSSRRRGSQPHCFLRRPRLRYKRFLDSFVGTFPTELLPSKVLPSLVKTSVRDFQP